MNPGNFVLTFLCDLCVSVVKDLRVFKFQSLAAGAMFGTVAAGFNQYRLAR